MSNGYALLSPRYFARMKTDALARRLRFAPPNALVRRLLLTEADFLLFEAIDRHGPLPTHYLYEFTRHLRRDYSHLQNRLTEFYNGDSAGPFLTRPPQQFAGFEARYQHVVYDLAPRARRALADRGALAIHSPPRTDPFLHRLMGACVAASIELAASGKALRYISREEILAHPKCPAATRNAANPMVIPLSGLGNRALIPDDLFGLEYPGAGFRFFAVEIDRNTESIERRNLEQSAFAKKIVSYLDILRTQSYRTWWGIPNLSILTVSTNCTHVRNLVGYLDRQGDRALSARFGFTFEPSFGANWRVPRKVLTDLVTKPWMALGSPKNIGLA